MCHVFLFVERFECAHVFILLLFDLILVEVLLLCFFLLLLVFFFCLLHFALVFGVEVIVEHPLNILVSLHVQVDVFFD